MTTSGKAGRSAIKRPGRIIAAALLLAAIAGGLWLALKPKPEADPPVATTTPPAPSPPLRPLPPNPPPGTKLPGEMILQAYASPGSRPQDDLHAVAHALDNLALLVKGNDPFRLGANEEFADALKGRNKAQIRFLRDDHPAFNEKGQLVDRWKTPLYIHAASRDRLEIRSAGPDQKMWTEDDLQRQPDGQFLKGKDLNPTSLYLPQDRPQGQPPAEASGR
jgi:hypothetical protein